MIGTPLGAKIVPSLAAKNEKISCDHIYTGKLNIYTLGSLGSFWSPTDFFPGRREERLSIFVGLLGIPTEMCNPQPKKDFFGEQKKKEKGI